VENGGTFSNWTALTGYESSDGKAGNWVLYNLNSTVAEDSVGWSTESNGDLDGTIVECNSSGVITGTLVFTGISIVNHSGDLKVYAGPVSTTYEDISWTASGGTWIVYYSGVTINSGHW
jgi:hypothetical protein